MRSNIEGHEFQIRRGIRGAAVLLLAALIIYLVADDVQKSRSNGKLLQRLEANQLDNNKRTVDSLAAILMLVQTGVEKSAAAGVEPKITLDQAAAALKKAFPAELVREAVKRVTTTTTTTTRLPVPTTQSPSGGTSSSTTPSTRPDVTTTSSTTTTTTTRCLLNLFGVVRIGC